MEKTEDNRLELTFRSKKSTVGTLGTGKGGIGRTFCYIVRKGGLLFDLQTKIINILKKEDKTETQSFGISSMSKEITGVMKEGAAL